jgi:hypothetical protein
MITSLQESLSDSQAQTQSSALAGPASPGVSEETGSIAEAPDDGIGM